MPNTLVFFDDQELTETARLLNGNTPTLEQTEAMQAARAQANFLQYAIRELPRDGKTHEPKRLRWAEIAPLCRKEIAHV